MAVTWPLLEIVSRVAAARDRRVLTAICQPSCHRRARPPQVRWLLAHGLGVNATNDSGETAVAEAASVGHLEVVWALLDAGGGFGSTPESVVMSAVRRGSETAMCRPC